MNSAPSSKIGGSAVLRFALIGCSAIAKKHAAALAGLEDAELAAVCDKVEERAAEFGKEYRVPHFTEYRKMLEEKDVDVVTVLTPTGDHAQRVMDVARFRKHIVVEKPMALRLDDADDMIRSCDEAGVKLFVVKQNRFNRPVQALRRALEDNRFGRMVLGTIRVRWCRTQAYYDAAPWRGTWAADGGVLTNQASHHIDLLQWMMGGVESVTAMTARRLVNIEAEDTGVAILRFQNGALGIIEATTATRPKDLEGSLSILGEKGSVVIGGFSVDRLSTWSFADAAEEDGKIFETSGENPQDFGWSHREYLKNVVGTLRSGKKALVDGLEARKSLELISAIYESAETGREVSLRFRPKQSRLGIKNDD